MLFNYPEKIKIIKDFLQKAPPFIDEMNLDLVCLAKARSKAKAQEWNQASIEYLNLSSKSFPNIPLYILREFFICLASIKYEPSFLALELGTYLYQYDPEFHQAHLQYLIELLIRKGELTKAHQIIISDGLEFLNDELKILKIKILVKLGNFHNAHSLIEQELENHAPSSHHLKLSTFLIALYSEKAKLHEIEGAFDEAVEVYQSILKYNPEEYSVKFDLATFYLKIQKEQEGIQIIEHLIHQHPMNLEYIQTYCEYLMTITYQTEKANEYANQFLENVQKEEEKLLFRIFFSWIQNQFILGKNQFEKVAEDYPNHPYLIKILYEYALKHQQSHYIYELKLKYPHLFEEQSLLYTKSFFSEKNTKLLIQSLNDIHHERPQKLQLPVWTQSILEDLSANGDAYLVGGCVLSLLKNQACGIGEDIDLIFISSEPNIPGYIPSPYIANLYTKDTRKHGGPSIDLMKISPQSSFERILEQNACMRDFTICALFCDKLGNLYDPCGRALQDFHLARLDTILDPSTTLKEDPVRILRAFKYICKGYKPSHELEIALRSLPSLNLSMHSHFNHVLLKECHALKNDEFVQILIQYDFLKHLDYLGIDTYLSDDKSVCHQLILSLYRHRLSIPAQAIVIVNSSKNLSNIEMLKQKIKYLRQDLELQNVYSSQLKQQDGELERMLLPKNELEIQVNNLQKQIQEKKQKVQVLLEQRELNSSKINRIAELKKILQEKKQSNQNLNQKIATHQQIAQIQIQEEYERLKEDAHHIGMKNLSRSQKLIRENDSIIYQIQNLEKKVLTEKDLFNKHQQQKHLLEYKIQLLQKCSAQLKNRTQESKFTIETLFENTNLRFPESQAQGLHYHHLYALEQMVHEVSKKELRSYLHAHICFKELSLSKNKQNLFKIYNHLNHFINFLPEELKPSYHETIQQILNQLNIPVEEFSAKQYLQLGLEAKKMMHIEKAIYYFEKAIYTYATSNTKNHQKNNSKIFFDAYLELYDLYFDHNDLIQINRIHSILKKTSDLPTSIDNKIKKFKQKIQAKYNLIHPIQFRDHTLLGYQDFLACNIQDILSANSTVSKKEILFQITQKTKFPEEYLLALIEYTFLLEQPYSDLQSEYILSLQRINSTVEILMDYLQAKGIPNHFIDKFNQLGEENFSSESLTDCVKNLPLDIEQIQFIHSYTQYPKLYSLASFQMAQHMIKKRNIWEALYYLEETSTFFEHMNRTTRSLHLELKDICWDSCDDTGWLALGDIYQQENQIESAIFCFSHAYKINPFRFEAFVKLSKIYLFKQDYQSLKRLIPMIEHVSENLSKFVNLKFLSLEQAQIFESYKNEMCEINSQAGVNHEKKKKLLIKVSENIAVSNVKQYDFSKMKLFNSLVWSFYSKENARVLEKIFSTNIFKRHEYALAHFESAVCMYNLRNLTFIYHYMETLSIWPNLKFLYTEMEQKTHLFENDLNYIKENYCMMLYNQYMLSIINLETSISIFIEYFQYFIQNHAFYLIEPKVIQAFLMLENISELLKFQCMLLLGEYQKAYQQLVKRPIIQEQENETRIFEWPANLESMMKYIQCLKQFYSQLMQAASPEYQLIAKSYLGKIVELDEYIKIQESILPLRNDILRKI